MADNVKAGSNDAGGPVFTSEDIGAGVQLTVVKPSFGAHGVSTPVADSAGNRLPVKVGDSLPAGAAIIGALVANQTVVDTAAEASLATIATNTGAATPAGANVIGGVTVASLPLPAGASTAAKQPALGTAGTASADVLTVQGKAAMTPLLVDGSGVTQPVSGTFWQATQPVSGTVTVQQATAANLKVDLSGTAANATALKVDGSAVTQPVSGTLSITANSAVNVAQVGGTATDTNSGNKSAGTQRFVLATDQPALTNALKVDGSAVTQPVSGTFFQGTQPVSIATAPVLVAGSAIIGKVGIDQTTPGTTNAVQANAGTNLNTSALALDTSVNGILLAQAAATSGQKGALIQAAVTTAAPTYVTGNTNPLSLTVGGFLRVADVTGQGSLATIVTNTAAATPAGTNLIGKVGIDQTTPGTTNAVQLAAALPAGTNAIGQVTAAGVDTGTARQMAVDGIGRQRTSNEDVLALILQEMRVQTTLMISAFGLPDDADALRNDPQLLN